jgi:hypothetical protein
MSAIRQQLDSLRSNLADKCPALHASLRPGLNDAAIDALVGPLQPFRLLCSPGSWLTPWLR